MSYGIAVAINDFAGGTQLGGNQFFFFVEAKPVVVIGDAVAPHMLHPATQMIEGSSWLNLNSRAACRQGHKAACGHPSSGRNWFFIAE